MLRHSHLAVLYAVVLASSALPAQAPRAGGPPAGTLGAEDRRRIDRLFEDYDRPDAPGCALGVMRNGRLAYARGYGMADLERGVRITPATLFDIGSTSKQFAAASLALLVEDGKLSFSDDVRKYIPELPNYGAPITIDHLLRHTSGLRDYNGLLALAGYSLEEVTTVSQALALVVRQRQLHFPTGSRFEYSNTGYFLASVIVQRVTGKSLAVFARERIFLPLGMTRTRYRNAYAMLIPGRALGYAPDDKGGFKISMSNWEETGDGAVHLSIEDALKWDENFYHPRVGGRELVERLVARGTLDNGDSIEYARGLFVDRYRGLRRVQHGGDWIGYHAAFTRFPSQHTSVAIFCNSDGIFPEPLADQVADIVLERAFTEGKSVAATPGRHTASSASRGTTPQASQLVGSYYTAATNTVMRVSEKNGALALHAFGRSLPLKPVGGATFAVGGFPATVEFSTDGQSAARSIRLRIESDTGDVAVRFTPATPSAEELRALAGTYYSPELDVTWPIAFEGGRLVLKNKKDALSEVGGALEPAMPDAFSAGAGFIHFTRNASGRVTGFELSASRMRGIRFDVRTP
jgi:CubicO group peptidase (beta-lactamase class C family)